MHTIGNWFARGATIMAAVAAIGIALLSGLAAAAEITVTSDFHILENRSVNSVNIVPGVRQQFGANAVPNGYNGTTGFATQGAYVDLPLNLFPVDIQPNRFARSLPAGPAPNGSWTLNFFNSGDTATVTTPTIAGASIMPFVSAMAIGGTGAMPTFTWTLPSNAPIDAVRVNIRQIDPLDRVGTGGVGGEGVGNIIYSNGFVANTNSFTVNPLDPGLTQPLLDGHQYSLEVQLRNLRNAAGGTGDANTLSQSRSFFDFSLLGASAPPSVYLPMINTEGGNVYEFQPISVVTGGTIFIDPLVAIGYDYQIGAGDPNFASVTLPTGIGDNLYEIMLWNGSAFGPGVSVVGGAEFSFVAGGVDRFRVTGIETSASLDPLNGTAFITGLSFEGNGTFTGTMTPLTVAIPEPETYALMLGGLGVLGFVVRRRKQQAA